MTEAARQASLDVDAYRRDAAAFLEEIDREYYRHLAGHKAELEIEPIYERHAGLFGRERLDGLRELAAGASGDEARRLGHLVQFALEGLMGRETRRDAEELGRLEASLEVDGPDGAIPYRGVAVAQANEPDGERRAALEQARDAVLTERLNPLHLAALEREHALCRELGWNSYADAFADVRGVDLNALAEQTASFLRATEGAYERLTGSQLERAELPPLGELRRSDLARFFRAPELDRL